MNNLPVLKDPVIYYLLKGSKIVYIGISENQIYSRISYHIKTKDFDRIKYEWCSRDELTKKESLLIRRHQPVYNLTRKRIKKTDQQDLQLNLELVESEMESSQIKKSDLPTLLNVNRTLLYYIWDKKPFSYANKFGKLFNRPAKDFII